MVEDSPLYPHIHGQIASADFWRWMDMFAAADRGSIRKRPVAFLTTPRRRPAVS